MFGVLACNRSEDTCNAANEKFAGGRPVATSQATDLCGRKMRAKIRTVVIESFVNGSQVESQN